MRGGIQQPSSKYPSELLCALTIFVSGKLCNFYYREQQSLSNVVLGYQQRNFLPGYRKREREREREKGERGLVGDGKNRGHLHNAATDLISFRLLGWPLRT